MRHPHFAWGLGALAALAAQVAIAQTTASPPVSPRSSAVGAEPGQGPFANRGGSLPPVVGWFQADGVKLVSLGETDGVRGYLAEAANGRFQTIYVSPDNEHVVAGILFGSGGANETGRQVAAMMRRFNAAATATPNADAGAIKAIPPEEPAPQADARPFPEWMRAQGVKLTPFLERDGGLDGYLAESKASEGYPAKMQPFYVYPDGRHAVAGILIRKGGAFVTALQIHALQEKFAADEAAARQPKMSEVVPGSANPPPAPKPPAEPAAAVAPSVPAPAPVPESKPDTATPAARDAAEAGTATPVAVPQADALPAPAPVTGSQVEEPLAQPAADPAPARPARPVAAAGSPAKPYVSVGPLSAKPPESAAKFAVNPPDKAQFLEDARSVVWFSVGIKGAPSVWMVADPQCPFCHETWRRLKPLVFDGKLQVRVILIAGLKGSDPYVRSILSRGEPVGAGASSAWLQGEGSVNNAAIQPPPADGTPANEAAKRFVAYNAGFAQKYQVSQTPFLFYTDPAGAMYASVGVPDDMDAFLSAVR